MIYPKEFLEYCQNIVEKLTSLRKSVLFVLWERKKPLKAYDILNVLAQSNATIKAPSVYRALDYFLQCGIVHKIESIQSYTLCCEPDKHLPSELLMVCNHCHQVQEIYDLTVRSLIQNLATKSDFTLGQEGIELRGLCQRCIES